MKSKNTSKKASGARASKKDLPVRKTVKGGSLVATALRLLEDTNKAIIGNIR
jgi:hypothetical protein